MCAQVANVDAMVHPALQEPRLDAVAIGDTALVGPTHALVHVRERSKRHDFRDDPDRQVGEFRVCQFEMLEEQFVGTLCFATQTIEPAFVVEVRKELDRCETEATSTGLNCAARAKKERSTFKAAESSILMPFYSPLQPPATIS